MEHRRSRRDLARGIVGAGASLALMRTVAAAASAQPSNGIDSAGIGLSLTEWEAIYGRGEALQSVGKYTDPTYGGPIYLGLDFVAFDDGLVDFIELQWSQLTQAGGISEDDAATQVRRMLPDDARMRESFLMHATPGGPIALRSERWTSRALGDVTDGRASMLVTYQQKFGQLNPNSGMDVIILAATLAVETA